MVIIKKKKSAMFEQVSKEYFNKLIHQYDQTVAFFKTLISVINIALYLI